MSRQSNFLFLCILVFGLAAHGAESTIHAIGNTSVPAELEKAFNEKFSNDPAGNAIHKWGTSSGGLRAALFTWVEPSTPRIHYVITIENVGTTPIEDYPSPTARVEAGWINRGMKKTVLSSQGTNASPLLQARKRLLPKENIHLYLGSSACQSRFQFMNYRLVSASLTNGRTVNTAIEPLIIEGVKCTDDKAAFKKTTPVAKQFDMRAFEPVRTLQKMCVGKKTEFA